MDIAGRYEIVRTLGHGSFGRTFLARDTTTGRDVAIKMLAPRPGSELKAYELFEREATVLRSLRHHGVPEVHASLRAPFEGTEAAFLVMEYVAGESLARSIDEQRHLEPGAILHLLLELAGILDYLHSRVPPILHRDIKPANIIVRPDGQPALVDFGAVRRVFLGPDESGSTVVGTYGYMPYEQYMGQATPASDLYALGATLLHLVTGRAPPQFMNEEGRIAVPENLPGDPRLRAVIERLLRPSPAERFASARALREALLAPERAAVAPRSGTAPVPAAAMAVTGVGPAAVARDAVTLEQLGPAPRPIDGVAKDVLRRASPSMWAYLDGSGKRGEGAGITGVLLLGFFSVMTAGILPAIFFSVAHERRRQVRAFLRQGLPATAVVQLVVLEELAFGEKLARVSYEFVADGALRRDSDRILPSIATRWRAGDAVQVLYLPENYDSIIISSG